MDTVPTPSFAKLLRRYRLAAGLTQEELAERAALSVRGISDLERSLKTRPHHSTVELIAEALGLSAEERTRLEASVPRSRRGPRPSLTSPTSLPAETTRLVGRERAEMGGVALLRSPRIRLLTLTGTGGVGKTRLALRIAATVSEDFEDGVIYVPLETIRDGALVGECIARALGLREERGRIPEEVVLSTLRGKHALLLLDNFEQVLPAGLLVSNLLAGCSGLKVLVTSRTLLRLRGEHELVVQPLEAPESATQLSIEEVTRYPAAALLLDRILAMEQDLAVTDGTAALLAEIARRLDGLPLALELAAARVKVLPLSALLEGLDQRLQVLTTGARDLPERHQTMRNTIAWSYDLLGPGDRALFRQLSVFAGGCDLQAVEEVCESGGHWDALDRLESLVEASLLRMHEQTSGQPRFTMLETIREFAAECLAESGEQAMCGARHAAYFLALVEKAEPELTGPRQVQWLERLDREHDNVRAALDWTGESGDVAMGLRLAGALWRYWSIRGYLSEGRRRLRLALGRARTSPAEASPYDVRALVGSAMLAIDQGAYDDAAGLCRRSLALARERGEPLDLILALNAHGTLARQQGRWDETGMSHEEALLLAQRIGDRRGEADALIGLTGAAGIRSDRAGLHGLLVQSEAIFRELGDIRGLADVLHNRALQALQSGDLPQGEMLGKEALTLYRALGDTGKMAEALYALGMAASFQEQYERAWALHEQSLAIRLERGDERNAAASRVALSLVTLNRGDVTRARTLAEDAVSAAHELNDRWGHAVALTILGHVELAADDARLAQTLFAESIALFRAIGYPFYAVWCLEGMAGVAAAQGQWRLAARLCGARDARRAAMGLRFPPACSEGYARTLTAVVGSLGEEGFMMERTAGETAPLEATVAEALSALQ